MHPASRLCLSLQRWGLVRFCSSGSRPPQQQQKKLHRVIFLLGKPGSGKGTQGELIVSRLGYKHLSAGALLRGELARLGGPKGGPEGADIASRMMTGRIVPAEITCRLLLGAMAVTDASDSPGFLIDGFPRNRDNLDVWRDCSVGVADTACVLLVDAPDDVCARRCLGRAGARPDDNSVTLAKRLLSYRIDTQPVIEHYMAAGLLHRVDGSGDPEAVFLRVQRILEGLR